MKLKKILLLIFSTIFILLSINIVEAVEIPENIENVTNEDILNIYDKITEQYSNDEIADMILENKEEISQEVGISESVINTGAEFIRNTDQEDIKKILENDENINEIRKKLKEGESPEKAIESAIEKTSTSQKINLLMKILLANKIVKTISLVVLILFIYCTITRCIIYKKAGRNWFAGLIPFYRQVTMYKVCGISPFLMLLWLIPIFGWIAMFIIAIMKRILLAENFGRGGLFGIGILILPPILYSVLAFNNNIEYEGE